MARGGLVVATFAAVAGAARLAQDAAIAWRFGAGSAVDAYYFVLSLYTVPVAVALSTLTLLMGPAQELIDKVHPGGRQQFQRECLGAVMVLAVLCLPLAWWSMGAVVGSQWSGLGEVTAEQATQGLPAIVLAVPFGLLGALFSAWLVAEGRHVLALLEALPPLVLVLVVLLAPTSSLYWATAVGVTLQLLAMALALHLRGLVWSPSWEFRSPAWRGFARNGFALLVAQLLFALIPLIDPLFAVRVGEGALSALSFANRLVLGLQGLAGLALQRASLPLLAALASAEPAQALRAALRWALMAALLGGLVGLIVAACADPLVSALFERGSFTVADRVEVAGLLRFGMLQMPAFLAGTVLATALAAARGGLHLILAAMLGLAVKVLASYVLVAHWGVEGLMLSTALMYSATSLLAWWALRLHLQRRTT